MCHDVSFLAKVDIYVEQVTRKVANYLSDVLEDQREKLLENLTANGMDLPTYLTRFQWDMAKYPIKQSLKSLSDIISEWCTIVPPSSLVHLVPMAHGPKIKGDMVYSTSRQNPKSSF